MTRFERILAVLILFAYAPALLAIGKSSLAADYYTHALLVPLVSLWLAARIPRRRWPIRDEHDGRALVIIAVASLLYLIGIYFASTPLQGVAFVLTVAGALGYARGMHALRVLAFPIAFLAFMIPLPIEWVRPLIFRLQIWVSSGAEDVLQAAGHTLLREGNVLTLPGGGRLFVAEACSGITSLFTMIPLGLLVAYLMERTWRRRLPIVVAVVPLALLENLLRVVTIVLLGERYGVEYVSATNFHETLGVLSYLITLGLLIAFAKLIRLCVPAPVSE